MATPHSNAPHLAVAQSNKEVTINTALDALDNAYQDLRVVSVAGDMALTAAQFRAAYFFQLTAAGVGADFTVALPSGINKCFAVFNTTVYTAGIEVESQPSLGVTLEAGKGAICYSDGETVYTLGGASQPVLPAAFVLDISDDGTEIDGDVNSMDFTGTGVTVTQTISGAVEINIPAPEVVDNTLEVQDDGFTVEDTTLTLNFYGSGVVVDQTIEGQVDIQIPGNDIDAGGGTRLEIQDNGAVIENSALILNFSGDGVETNVNTDGSVDVIVPGGAATTILEETASFSLTDAHLAGNVIIEVNSASAVSVFLEAGLTNSEPVTIVQTGVGQVSVVDDSAVSLNSASGQVSSRVTWSAFSIIPRGTDTYLLVGDLA